MADVGVEVEDGRVRRRAGKRDRSVSTPMPSSLRAEDVDVAEPCVGVDLERDVLGHGDDELADAEVGVDRRRARRGARRRRGRGRARRCRARSSRSSAVTVSGRSFFSPTPGRERDGRRGGDGEAASSTSPRHDEAADAALRHRADRDRGADDRDRDGEREGEVDLVDVEHRQEAEEAGGSEERADDGCEQRRPLRGAVGGGRRRSLSGPRSSGSGDRAAAAPRRPVALRHVPPDERATDEGRREPDVARPGPEVRLREREAARRRASSPTPRSSQGRSRWPGAPRPRSTPRRPRPGMTSHAAR